MFTVFNFTTKDISISEHLWPFCWWIPLQLSPWTCSWMCAKNQSNACEQRHITWWEHVIFHYLIIWEDKHFSDIQANIASIHYKLHAAFVCKYGPRLTDDWANIFLWSNPLPVHKPITILLNSILLHHEWQHHFVHMCSML